MLLVVNLLLFQNFIIHKSLLFKHLGLPYDWEIRGKILRSPNKTLSFPRKRESRMLDERFC